MREGAVLRLGSWRRHARRDAQGVPAKPRLSGSPVDHRRDRVHFSLGENRRTPWHIGHRRERFVDQRRPTSGDRPRPVSLRRAARRIRHRRSRHRRGVRSRSRPLTRRAPRKSASGPSSSIDVDEERLSEMTRDKFAEARRWRSDASTLPPMSSRVMEPRRLEKERRDAIWRAAIAATQSHRAPCPRMRRRFAVIVTR